MVSLDTKTLDSIQSGPVVIFGAGIVGEVLFHACLRLGVKVVAFCDNNVRKTAVTKCEIDVLHTEQVPELYPDALYVISAADIQDVVKQLEALGCERWCPGSSLLKPFDLSLQTYSAPMDFVTYAVDTCILCHDSFLQPDKLFLRSVDVVITERCSLKCQDCSNLMQYYEKPVNYDVVEMFQSVEALCELVDEINEFRVIGGEPFMNREFDRVIRRLNQADNVKKVIIYTNGTIVPSRDKMECLKHDKVLLIITDYGELSRNLDTLTAKLQSHGIAHFVQAAQGWTDCSSIKKHGRSREQQNDLFDSCCAKNTTTLLHGRLYRCPFAAHAMNLNAAPNCSDDYVDVNNEMGACEDVQALKRRVIRFLYEKESLHVCDFCCGRSFDAPEIKPAVQTRTPLAYERYV